MDLRSYRPGLEALRRLAPVDFVAVVGPSGVGKTTLIREAAACECHLHPVRNNTSRERRPDESDGVEYRFETRERMTQRLRNREYVQVAPSVFGDLYATAADDYSTEGVALLPVLAEAVDGFRALPFRSVRAVYVLPPSWESWRWRVAERQGDPERLRRRMAEALRSLEFAEHDRELQFVVNDDLPTAVSDLSQLALRRSLIARLAGDQRRARILVRELLAAMRTG